MDKYYEFFTQQGKDLVNNIRSHQVEVAKDLTGFKSRIVSAEYKMTDTKKEFMLLTKFNENFEK